MEINLNTLFESNRWQLSEDGSYYALKNVFFVSHVLSEEHQHMDLYVPAAYLDEAGQVDPSGECNGFTALSAPVIFFNQCGGWFSSTPAEVEPDWIKAGFVQVSVGARSRGLPGGIGKSPAAAVDQKAAVRLLRLYDQMIPGDKEKIISVGTSGGGQMSSILGASGNMEAYYPYLYALGAAGVEKTDDGRFVSTIRDDIFASQCYCPIADIENADMAYAWQRYDDPNTHCIGFNVTEPDLTPFQIALHKDLARRYTAYLNSLGLRTQDGKVLSFDDESGRSGSYYDSTLKNISDALNAFLREHTNEDGSISFLSFDEEEMAYPNVDEYFATFEDTENWLKKENGAYRVTDLLGFVRGTRLVRGKSVPGFDTFHHTAENNAFGTPEEIGAHFASSVGKVMKENLARYKTIDGVEKCDIEAYIADADREDLKEQTYLYNATAILLDAARGKVKADPARHWRTRNGTADEHTAFSVAYNLALAAGMAGAESVDYALVWAMGHADVDGHGTGSFVGWVRRIAE